MTKDASKLMEKALNLSSKEMDSSGFKLQSAPKKGAIKAASVSLPKFAKAKLSAKRISKTSTPYSGKAEIKVPKPTISVSKTTVAAIPVAKLPEIANAKDPTSRLPFADGGYKKKRRGYAVGGNPVDPNQQYRDNLIKAGFSQSVADSIVGSQGSQAPAPVASSAPNTMATSPVPAAAAPLATAQAPVAQAIAPVSIAPVLSQNENLIPEYRSNYVYSALGRDITPEENTQWQNYLDTNTLNDQQIKDYIYQSPEAQQYLPTTIKEYRNDFVNRYLGRDITDEENQSWQNYIDNMGLSNDQIKNAIASSQDATNHFINQEYNNYIGRDALPEERSAWVEAFKNGVNKNALSNAFHNNEYSKDYLNKQFVNNFYKEYKGRDATPEELAIAKQELGPDKTIASFLNKTFPEKFTEEGFDIASNAKSLKGIKASAPEKSMLSNLWNKIQQIDINSLSKGAKDFLNFISGGEGSYNSVNKGSNKPYTHDASQWLGKPLTSFSIGDIMKKQKDGDIFATGKFQIIPVTLKDIVNKYGIDKSTMYDEGTQERLGLLLAMDRPGLRDYLLGRSNNISKAGFDAGHVWASLPNAKTGKSYYGHGNKAQHTVDATLQALRNARGSVQFMPGAGQFLGGGAGTTPPSGGGGGTIRPQPGAPSVSDQKSIEDFYNQYLYDNQPPFSYYDVGGGEIIDAGGGSTGSSSGSPPPPPGMGPSGDFGGSGGSSIGNTGGGVVASDGVGSGGTHTSSGGGTSHPVTHTGGVSNSPVHTGSNSGSFSVGYQSDPYFGHAGVGGSDSIGSASHTSGSDPYFGHQQRDGNFDPHKIYYNPITGSYLDSSSDVSYDPNRPGSKRGGRLNGKALKLAKEPSIKDTLRLAKETLSKRRGYADGGSPTDPMQQYAANLAKSGFSQAQINAILGSQTQQAPAPTPTPAAAPVAQPQTAPAPTPTTAQAPVAQPQTTAPQPQVSDLLTKYYGSSNQAIADYINKQVQGGTYTMPQVDAWLQTPEAKTWYTGATAPAATTQKSGASPSLQTAAQATTPSVTSLSSLPKNSTVFIQGSPYYITTPEEAAQMKANGTLPKNVMYYSGLQSLGMNNLIATGSNDFGGTHYVAYTPQTAAQYGLTYSANPTTTTPTTGGTTPTTGGTGTTTGTGPQQRQVFDQTAYDAAVNHYNGELQKWNAVMNYLSKQANFDPKAYEQTKPQPPFAGNYVKTITEAAPSQDVMNAFARVTLGREVTPDEAKQWQNGINSGMTNAQIFNSMQNSPEAQKYTKYQISNLYDQNIGMRPSEEQVNTIANDIAAGKYTFSQLDAAVNSTNLADDYRKNQLNDIFTNATGLQLTPEQAASLSKDVFTGKYTIPQLESAWTNYAPTQQSALEGYWQDLTGKELTPEQKAGLNSALTNKTYTPVQIAESMANSPDAANYDNIQFLKDEYQGLLGKEPSPDEIKSGLDLLNKGMSWNEFDKNLSKTDASQQYQASNFEPYQEARAGKSGVSSQPRTALQISEKIQELMQDQPLVVKLATLLRQEGEQYLGKLTPANIQELAAIGYTPFSRAAVGYNLNSGVSPNKKSAQGFFPGWFNTNDKGDPGSQIMAPAAYSAMKSQGRPEAARGLTIAKSVVQDPDNPLNQNALKVAAAIMDQAIPNPTPGAFSYLNPGISSSNGRKWAAQLKDYSLGKASPSGKHQYFGSNVKEFSKQNATNNLPNVFQKYGKDKGSFNIDYNDVLEKAGITPPQKGETSTPVTNPDLSYLIGKPSEADLKSISDFLTSQGIGVKANSLSGGVPFFGGIGNGGAANIVDVLRMQGAGGNVGQGAQGTTFNVPSFTYVGGPVTPTQQIGGVNISGSTTPSTINPYLTFDPYAQQAAYNRVLDYQTQAMQNIQNQGNSIGQQYNNLWNQAIQTAMNRISSPGFGMGGSGGGSTSISFPYGTGAVYTQ